MLSVPCVMASPVSPTSFSSFSSCTQEAAAIWAKAEAQLAATPDRHTHALGVKISYWAWFILSTCISSPHSENVALLLNFKFIVKLWLYWYILHAQNGFYIPLGVFNFKLALENSTMSSHMSSLSSLNSWGFTTCVHSYSLVLLCW